MTMENLKKIHLEDGDILLHETNDPSESKQLMDALELLHPNKKILLITNYDSSDVLASISNESLLEIQEIILQQLRKRGLSQ